MSLALKRPPLGEFRHPGELLELVRVASDLGRGAEDEWKRVEHVRLAIVTRYGQTSSGSTIVSVNDKLRELTMKIAWMVKLKAREVTTGHRIRVYGRDYQITSVDDPMLRGRFLRLTLEVIE